MLISESGRCYAILSITAVFAAIEIAGSLHTNSLGLLGEGVHIIGDGLPFVGALILAKRWVRREMEGRLEWGVRTLNQAFLFTGGAYLSIMGAYHLWYPREIGRDMAIFALAGFFGNAAQAYFAHDLSHLYSHHATHRSQMLHLLYDIAASGAVLIAAAVIWMKGWDSVDAILSLVLGIATIYAAKHIGEEAERGQCGHTHHH